MPSSGDYPDIYADGMSVTITPVSTILTFTRIQPTGEPGQHQDPSEIVGRVRVSPPVAAAIAQALNQLAAQVAVATQEKAVKH